MPRSRALRPVVVFEEEDDDDSDTHLDESEEIEESEEFGGSDSTESADEETETVTSSSTVLDFTSLDETLWGALQNHIDLAQHVYSKLPPLEDFFNLRTVCKAWYNVACKRLALKERRMRKPFFTLYTKGARGRLEGILTYNNVSKSWNWTRSRAHHLDFESQLVSIDSVVYRMPSRLYDWKYGRSFSLPRPPVRINSNAKTMIGMSVAQDENGLRSLKIVLGSREFDTQVYDSKTKRWETKNSSRPMRGDFQASTGCVECDGRLYITTEHQRRISVYDVETARWSSIKSPVKWVALRNVKKRQHACLDTLGAWNGRVFDVTVSSPSHAYYDLHVGASQSVGRLTVWELVDEEWRRFDCMPKATYAWLRSTKGFRRVFNWKSRVGHVAIHASFCAEFVLVYSWNYSLGEAGRFCLYDMASKNWHKLQVPTGKVGVRDDDDEPEREFVPPRNFSFTGLGFGYMSELLDPEDSRYFTCGADDMSDSELDVFLEENGYESHPASDESDSDDDMQRRRRR